jgi:hypothetical protein
MTLLVILFFFGLSAGVIAKIKGNSFFLWFLIGFCLPFVGTVAAMLHRSDRDEPRRACEECGKVLPLHVQVCTRCGRDLDLPIELEAVGAPQTRW